MINFTDAARDRVLALIDQVENSCLRLAVAGGSPFAPEFDLSLVDNASLDEEDQVVELGGVTVLLDRESVPQLRGMTIDYVERNGESGFQVRPSRVEPADASGPLAERVQRVIDERINPGVASHGGRIELVGVKDDIAFITMSGGCQGCAMSQMTLRQGVERMIREVVPEIEGIRDVTDHSNGQDPYYA